MTAIAEAAPISSHSPGSAGLAISLMLHVVVLAGVVLIVHPAALPEAADQIVMVELVAAPAAVAATTQTLNAAEAMQDAGESIPDESAAPPSGAGMIEATQMLAVTALADPRNAEARKMLGMIETSLRREQVCGIEAMEQIKSHQPDWSPECVISYVFSDTRLENNTVIAKGATVMNGTHWYRLEYECTLGADLASVTGFRYRVGGVVPEEDQERLGLAPCM